MKYETSKYLYDSQQVQTIRSFGDNIYNGKISISEADKKQHNFLNSILEFNNKARRRLKADKEKKTSDVFRLFERQVYWFGHPNSGAQKTEIRSTRNTWK